MLFVCAILCLFSSTKGSEEQNWLDNLELYSYFPLYESPVFIPSEKMSRSLQQPRLPEVPFLPLEEIRDPPDILYGRFQGLFKLFDQYRTEPINRTKVTLARKAVANVIHYLESGIFRRITNPDSEQKAEYENIVNSWLIFYYCITTYNFRKHYGPCTYGMVITRNASIGYKSALDWDPARDLDWIPQRDTFLLILYNLALCQHYEKRYTFLCPSVCLGRVNPGLNRMGITTKFGNPCENKRNTKSPACSSRRVWNIFIYNLFADLVRPSQLTLLPGEGDFLKWVTKESGYSCDCAAHYRWVDTTLQCERATDWVDQCKSSSSGSVHSLGPCNQTGTYQCTTDQNTGAAYCECNPGYTGARCEMMLDACLMSLVTYMYKDPKTGKRVRKTASGMEMCNVNMSGLQARTKLVESLEDLEFSDSKPKLREVFIHSQCIPSLGTTGYRCQCEPPFTEDTSHPMPNCFKRTGPCDERLCLHGTCVASSDPNATSICVCNPGYDGPQCERRADHWSVWSECLPICGTNRTRTRRRSTIIRDPSAWEPRFDDLAELPNKMSDLELLSYPGELIQTEVCPPRTGTQCPFSPNNPNYQSLAATDPGHDLQFSVQGFSGDGGGWTRDMYDNKNHQC
ncbi:Acidic fibroblast growth factor intracellular binding protein [Fasciola gigantica]|uniref:Acidic fibroblast growth factor intracellular binding protein n=1 Tax=Fasciola gigantica TaxID=46835 RepID=A0A504Y866_FASGI|nr:Acidic fibroblast growth factor intracellular binding protein [Fasciola gigantica]